MQIGVDGGVRQVAEAAMGDDSRPAVVRCPSVTARALWKATSRPDSAAQLRPRPFEIAGLPIASPSTVATWSEPMTTAPACVAETA